MCEHLSSSEPPTMTEGHETKYNSFYRFW
jgi:hypothetical protein